MPGGDCFQAALAASMEPWDGCTVWLVHGIVVNTGEVAGEAMWHAWVEVVPPRWPTLVVDRSGGRDVQVPQALYYRLGQVRRTWRWQAPQAVAVQAMLAGHHGPWVDGWEDMAL